MANDKHKTGYSEALGGYGVPSQVEMTVESASPRKRGSEVFRQKPMIIIIIVVIAVVAFLAVMFGSGKLIKSPYEDRISSIEEQMQTSNGADTTNYKPILAEDVDWAGLTAEERKGIAEYAVKKALAKAKSDQVGIYNILGMTNSNEVIFQYKSDGSVPIYLNGQVEDTIQVK